MAYRPGLFGGARPMDAYNPRQFWAAPQTPQMAQPQPAQAPAMQKPPGLFGGAAPQKAGWKAKLSDFVKSGQLGDIGQALLANSQNGGSWGGALGTYGQLSDRRKDQAENDARKAQLAEMVDSLGIKDPGEAVFARMNPEKYLAEHYGKVDPVTLAEGSTMFDPKTGQVIARNEAAPKSPKPIRLGDRLIDPITFKPLYEPPPERDTGPRYSFINPGNGTVVRANPSTGEYETIVQGGPAQQSGQGAPNGQGRQPYGGEFIRTGIGEDGRYAATDGDPEVQGGLPPPRFNTFDLTTPGARGTLIGKEDERMAEMRDAKNAALKVKQLSDKFIEIAGDAPWQGEGFINDIGQGVSALTDGKKTQLQQINNELAPAVRQAGSGAMSDKDVEMYKSSVVHFNNQPEGNAMYALRANAVANRLSEYYAFMQSYRAQYGPGSLQEAERYWTQYADAVPVFDDYGNVSDEAISSYEFFTGRTPQVNPYNRSVGGLTNKSPEEMSDEDILDALGIK